MAVVALATPSHAVQPIILQPGMPTEAGIMLSWNDAAPALAYVIERTDANGTTTATSLPGHQDHYTDPVDPGVYTYTVTAKRIDGDDVSNPSPAMAWPYCLPDMYAGPPYFGYEAHCYCPLPPPLDPWPPEIC